MELFYKGYRTIIEYDEEEKYFYGKLEGIVDFVNFGTEFEDKIAEEFHSAVDDYLDYCQAKGKEPNREVENDLNLRVNFKMYDYLESAAKKTGENITELAEKALADYLLKLA